MQKKQFVAIDTNIALLLAEENETAVDAVELIRSRLRNAQILASRTVIQELTFQSKHESDSKVRASAGKALMDFQKLHIAPAPLDDLQKVIAAKAADDLRHSGLIAFEERNDAFIVAESAVLNCILLVSNDSHLLEIDAKQLALLFRERDLPAPIIVSPRDLVHRFYR